jgi:dsRNA-specific ribonuclease
MKLMSKKPVEDPSDILARIHHYQRLEFLGDAVLEFIASVHLFNLVKQIPFFFKVP